LRYFIFKENDQEIAAVDIYEVSLVDFKSDGIWVNVRGVKSFIKFQDHNQARLEFTRLISALEAAEDENQAFITSLTEG